MILKSFVASARWGISCLCLKAELCLGRVGDVWIF